MPCAGADPTFNCLDVALRRPIVDFLGGIGLGGADPLVEQRFVRLARDYHRPAFLAFAGQGFGFLDVERLIALG